MSSPFITSFKYTCAQVHSLRKCICIHTLLTLRNQHQDLDFQNHISWKKEGIKKEFHKLNYSS